jgi:hypothetical protein
MCEFIEKLFIEQIKPEEIDIQLDEEEVFKHYDKDKDELLIMIGKLKAENYKLTQKLVGLDLWLKQIVGELHEENKKLNKEIETEKLEQKKD